MSQLHINKSIYNIYKYTAFLSIAAIFLLGVAFLQPTSFHENANAETASLDTSVTLEPAITIWTTDTSNNTSSQVNIAADPDESVATGSIRTHVSTNNLTGYTLTIQSNSTDAKMTHENESVTKTINPLTGSGTSANNWKSNSNLNNMWGYSIGTNDSFVGVPGSSSDATTIDETDAPNNDNYTDVTFATKADLSLPAGTYTDTVIFSAVANAVPTTLKQAAAKVGITTMQGMESSTVCSEADVWQEGEEDLTLTDTRDNESYVIRKLTDGHCWMTSNLRLRGENLASGVSTTLNSTNTDLTSGSTFVLPSSATWTSTSSTNKGLIYSGDSNAKIGPSQTAAVSGEQAQARGTYYTWCTATANCDSAAAIGGSAQPNSICPKGWKLPNSDGSSTSSNQFWNLYNSYSGSSQYTDFMKAFNYYYSNGAAYYLAGHWSTGGYVFSSGEGGYWWSSTPHSSGVNRAWYMYAITSSVGPAGDGARYTGYSVRCMLSS